MIDSQYEQLLLKFESLLIENNIKYERRGHIFDLKLFKVIYQGPQLNFQFKTPINFYKPYLRFELIKHYTDIYLKYLQLLLIDDLQRDMIHYEILQDVKI